MTGSGHESCNLVLMQNPDPEHLERGEGRAVEPSAFATKLQAAIDRMLDAHYPGWRDVVAHAPARQQCDPCGALFETADPQDPIRCHLPAGHDGTHEGRVSWGAL